MTAISDIPTTGNNYILTRVGQKDLFFLAQWVEEFAVIERSQVLSLPFYLPAVIGLIHYRRRMLPLVAIKSCLDGGGTRQALGEERLTVLCMSQAAPGVGGVGLIVDRLLGNRSTLEPTAEPFNPQIIPDNLWQPLRWQKLAS